MTRWIYAAALMLLATPGLARAQSTVYLLIAPDDFCPGECPGRLSAVDIDTQSVTMTTPIPAAYGLHFGGGVYATPDGRFIVWRGRMSSGGERLLARFDVLTRQTTTFRIADDPTRVLPSRLFGHPSRTEIYTADASGAVAVSPAGTRAFVCPGCTGPATAVAFSGDGSRVGYQYGDILTTTVFDTASGARLSTIAHGFGRVALSRDGQELLVAGAASLRRYAVSGGALLQDLTVSSSIDDFFVDPGTGEAFVVSYSALIAYAGNPLAEVRASVAPWVRQYTNPSAFSAAFDPARRRVYFTSQYTVEPGTPYNLLMAFDLDQMRSLASVDMMTSTRIDPGRFVVAPHPAAASALAAAVTGSSVQLSWTPGASTATTTRHVLEVGSGPGLANIYSGLEIGPQASFGASGVPPGRYYVRVRAGNYAGLSGPSNEVVVQVP